MEEFYPDVDDVFRQDNGTSHTSKNVRNFIFQNEGLKVLNWPGNFSDLNLIENFWSIVN